MASDEQIAAARAAGKEAYVAHLKAYPDKFDEAVNAAWDAGIDAAYAVTYAKDDDDRNRVDMDRE